MASTVTWQLSLNEIEIGKEVDFFAEGLDSHEGMAVFIDLPDGSTFMWGVQADANGRVRDRIKLDSGLGQYLFCPKPACGNVVPRCAHLNVCPCGTSATNCNIQVEGPAQIVVGVESSFRFTGLIPSHAVTIKTANNQFTTSYINAIADIDGSYVFTWKQMLGVTYAVTISDGTCTSAPHIVDVIYSQNEAPVYVPNPSNDCASPIDLILAFDKGTYNKGFSGTLTLTVCNRGAQTRDITLVKSLSLNGATITADNIPTSATVAGYTCEEFTLKFTNALTDGTVSATVSGSYTCNGTLYTANRGSAHAIVGNGEGTCSAMLQYFGTTDGDTNVAVNVPVELTLQILNTGNVPLSQIRLSHMNVPPEITLGSSFPLFDTAIPVGGTGTITLDVTPTDPGSYTISISGADTSYRCGTNDIPLNAVGFITLVVS